MLQSHAGYVACGLGSPGTQRIVDLARQHGPARGIFGARITGGGSGGTVAVLAAADAGLEVVALAELYAQEQNTAPYIFSGSSPGAAAFGHLELVQA
jgi:L-arabinokinase